MSYSFFARYYDALTMNVSYDTIAKRYDELVTRFGGRKDILLDLGCGTGSLCECMARLGYDCIGIDNSEDMLNEALDKKYDSGLNIQYLCQDMTRLDMFGTIDVTVSSLDCLNHLDSLDDVRKTFERVSLFAYPDGLFIFDMNTPYKHKYVLGDNVFVYDTEDVYCVWQNSFCDENNKVEITLDFFERDGDIYERQSEQFCELAYDDEVIKRLLCECGFELLAQYDDFSDNEVTEKTQRILYVAKKVK